MTDVAQGWVANAPMLVPREAAGSTTKVPSVGDATGSAGFDAVPSFENTRDPLLFIGRMRMLAHLFSVAVIFAFCR